MPLFDPYRLVNPYAAAFGAWPLPAAVKIETGPASSNYQYEQQGIRSETSQVVMINRGEIEAAPQPGDFVRFQIPVITDTASYYQEQVTTNADAGGTSFIPVQEDRDLTEPPDGGSLVFEPYALEQTPYIPYEDLSQYNYGQGGYVETAPYIDPYQYADPGYYYAPPDNAAPYVPPPPDPTGGTGGGDPPPPEVADPEQAAREQAERDFIDYTRALEEQEAQYGYYGQYYGYNEG